MPTTVTNCATCIINSPLQQPFAQEKSDSFGESKESIPKVAEILTLSMYVDTACGNLDSNFRVRARTGTIDDLDVSVFLMYAWRK